MTSMPNTEGRAGRYPDLASRTAVVTGAAKGIGKSIACRLARECMNLVAADKDCESLDDTVRTIEELGAAVVAVCADLTQPDAVDAVFDAALERFGAVDVLVNNAADLQRRHLLEEHRDLPDLQLATNVRSPYLCSQRAASAMSANGGGSIVLVSSVGADRAHQHGLPYDMTKGAINSLARAMAVELGPLGIRVNAVGPGVTRTYRLPPEAGTHGPPEQDGTETGGGHITLHLVDTAQTQAPAREGPVDLGGTQCQVRPAGRSDVLDLPDRPAERFRGLPLRFGHSIHGPGTIPNKNRNVKPVIPPHPRCAGLPCRAAPGARPRYLHPAYAGSPNLHTLAARSPPRQPAAI